MEIVNPIASSLAQSTTVAKQQSSDKSQQIRRAQAIRKDVTAGADTFEHQVESCEEDTPIHEEQRKKESKDGNRQPKRKTSNGSDDTDDRESHIDLTA